MDRKTSIGLGRNTNSNLIAIHNGHIYCITIYNGDIFTFTLYNVTVHDINM